MSKLTKAERVFLEIAVKLGKARVYPDQRRQAASLEARGMGAVGGSLLDPVFTPTNAGYHALKEEG